MAQPSKAPRVRERLTAAREARGIDRAAAAAATQISLRYLGMLEDGQYPLVSDPAYLAPFLRRYATFLGLPVEETVADFLAENEAAERIAAASVSVPSPMRDEDDTAHVRPFFLAAAVLAALGGATVALVDGATLQRWMGSVRASLNGAVASIGRLFESPTSTVGAWFDGEGGVPPVDPVPPRADEPSVEVAVAEATPRMPAGDPPAETPLTVPTPPPMATAPPATTPMQISAAPSPARAKTGGPQRLVLLATARQVFVWVTIDGVEQREIELRRGESATFEARRELVLTLDDAGGVLATLNGKKLPPLGASGYGRRNIRIAAANQE